MKRLFLVVVAVLALSACTASRFVKAGRSTILSMNEAVTVVDHVAEKHYADAPETPEIDAQIDEWTCVIIMADEAMLQGWEILARVEQGPPKLSAADGDAWWDWLGTAAALVMRLDRMLRLNGLDTKGLGEISTALEKYFPVGKDDPLPPLDCSEVLP